MGIYVKKDATIEVKAPRNLPKGIIDKYVETKSSWIEENLSKMLDKVNMRNQFTLKYGDTIFVAGKEHVIHPSLPRRYMFCENRLEVPSGLEPEEIRRIVIMAYKKIAKQIIRVKVDYYSEKLNVLPDKVGITSANTNWGSCSIKGNLNFSWKLLLADEEEIVDYVVVHELSHLKEHNHSSAFWEVVASVMPEYKEIEKKLKTLQDRISKEYWD